MFPNNLIAFFFILNKFPHLFIFGKKELYKEEG